MNITNNLSFRDKWLQHLSDSITDPIELLQILKLEQYSFLYEGLNAKRLFPFLVPRSFVSRMQPGNPKDPLLLQVLTTKEEFLQISGFIKDPLNEKNSVIVPGLLHKYYNRALLLLKGNCALNCRFCFRRYFPYKEHILKKFSWLPAIEYIRQCSELNEIILSGGDPLMAKDDELNYLINFIEDIPHITILRIHSRLPVIIPERITPFLCKIFLKSRLNIVLVTHINHAQEINETVCESMYKLHKSKVTLLNQSVLLHGINDNANTLLNLSYALFSAGILPYYLHMLDCVHGTYHFLVKEKKAKKIMQSLLENLSGYLIPRLVREIEGKSSKIPINLKLK